MSPPTGVEGPRGFGLSLHAASATTAPRAATRVRVFSRNIFDVSGRGLEGGFEAERQDIGVQRVDAAVQGEGLRGSAPRRSLVDAAAPAGGKDVRIRRVEGEPSHERDADAEHAVGAVHLRKKRRYGLIGSSGGRGGDAPAQGNAVRHAVLDAQPDGGDVVVVLHEHLGRCGTLEGDRELVERLPADIGVVEAQRGALEASVGETRLDLGRGTDLSSDLVREESAGCGELTPYQGVHRWTCRPPERVVRREYEPGRPRLERSVSVVVVEGERRQKARAHLPRRAELAVHAKGEAEGARRALEARTGELGVLGNT